MPVRYILWSRRLLAGRFTIRSRLKSFLLRSRWLEYHAVLVLDCCIILIAARSMQTTLSKQHSSDLAQSRV